MLLSKILGNQVIGEGKVRKIDRKQIELTEKDLHCLARLMQSEESITNVKCLYCRYAIECKEDFMQNKKLQHMTVLKKLEQITGVNIFMNQKTIQKEILAGSWIEKNPELLKLFPVCLLQNRYGF